LTHLEVARHGIAEVEASAWIAQLNSDLWSQADQAALREWCRRSPANRAALRRLGATWADLDDLASLRTNYDRAERHDSARPLRWSGFWLSHAALAAALLGMVVSFGVDWVATPEPAVQFYATNIGEQRTVELPDSSIVRLNTSSLLEVSYGPDERRLRLVKGEALFNVTKDPNRPFVVNAGGNTVRAVGTRFTVRMGTEAIEVVVSEGAVALLRSAVDGAGANVDGARALVLRPNEVAIMRDRAADPIRITSIETPQLERRLAWTDGMLEFDGEHLATVVAEVSRYTPVKITIADPKLRQMPVGGRFRIGETQTLFEVIEAGFGAKIVYDKNEVRIEARRPQ